MDKRVMITIPNSTRQRWIGKVLVILISGCLFGYWFSSDSAAKYEKGKQLTLQQYTANFEQYKAKLLSPGPIPTAGGIFVMLIILSIFFGLYELLGLLLGLIIGKILNPKESLNDDN